MKFQLITLLSLGLCFAAVVSAYYDDDSVDNDGQECLGEVMQCAYHVQQYQAPEPNQMAAKLRQAGLRAVCRDSTKAAECVLKVILNGKCNAIPEDTKRIFQKVFDFNNFLCVDKINDLENHWECLFNVALDQKLGACQNMNAGLDQCDTSSYMNCVEGTFSSSALCKPGAKELVREIINKLVQTMPHCSDHKKVHRAVMNFMKKK